jgi:hypothetical protein
MPKRSAVGGVRKKTPTASHLNVIQSRQGIEWICYLKQKEKTQSREAQRDASEKIDVTNNIKKSVLTTGEAM